MRTPNELFWVKRYHSFKSIGYLLRPRYHPDWKPSWTPGHSDEWLTEESRPARAWLQVMDAVKMDESKKVVLKHITIASELMILQYLSSVADEKNHTVPLLELIRIHPGEAETGEVYLVMPFLRRAFEPPYFQRLGEVLAAIHQFLIGLEFMHTRNIAHRDACYGNLMVDASQFLPEHHFVAPNTSDGVHPIQPLPRSTVPVIKYFFIDFGLSMWFPSDEPLLATGRVGQDRTVPEWHHGGLPYDPFKVDIYQLGNVISKELIKKYTGLEFLRPLGMAMTHSDPSQRPSATEARERFESLISECDGRHFVCVSAETTAPARLIIWIKNWLMTRKRHPN